MVPLDEETGKAGHRVFAAHSSGLVEKAFKVGWEAVASASFRRLSRGPGESPKRSWELFGDDSSMVVGGHQEGQRSFVGEINKVKKEKKTNKNGIMKKS